MATYNIDRINFQGNTYLLRDTTSGYSTGGSGSGSVTRVIAGTGLSVTTTGEDETTDITTSGTINHTNSTLAKDTQGLYPITYDSEGHITGSGEAITNISYFINDVGYLTNASVPEGASAYDGTISAIDTMADSGSNPGFARGDHVHNITDTTIINALGFTPYNSTNPNGYTSNIGTVTGITLNNTTYNPTNGIVDLGTISSGGGGGTPTSFGITYDSDNDTTDGAGQAIINFITGDGLNYDIANAATSKLSAGRWGVGNTLSSITLTVPANGIYLLLGGKYNNPDGANYAGAWILTMYNGVSSYKAILTPSSGAPSISPSGLSVTLTPATQNYYFTLIGVHA